MAVITISRQFGAGGITLGRKLADTLGYAFFDEEVIAMVSTKAHLSNDWVQAIEKETDNQLQQAVSNLMPKSVVDRVLQNEDSYLDEEIYYSILEKVIRQFADSGNCIILGRGSQYILQGRDNTYHILLIADMEYRIRFLEARYKLRRNQAEHVVQTEDKRRTNLYQKINKSDYDRPSHYHLTLNMSKLSIDKAADMVCLLVGSG
jgi:cytidylate kinase